VHVGDIALLGVAGKALGDGVDLERMTGPVEESERTETDDGKAKVEEGVCGWVGVLHVVLEVEGGERESLGFQESGDIILGEQK
jgi:hypothetical protein